MNGARHRWHIEPGAPRAGERALFTADGDHAMALVRLLREPAAGYLPDEALLVLHAYELLERLREAEGAEPACLRFPFWPESLLAAAGVRGHAAGDLQACMPGPAEVTCALPSDPVLEAAAVQWFGALRFDPRQYRWSLRACARRHGFQLPAPTETAAMPAAEGRLVVGALLLQNDRLLLERRPDGAAVYAGVWDTPGGHVEAGETPAAALVRELREELGIEAGRLTQLADQSDRDATSGRLYRHVTFAVTGWQGRIQPRQQQTLRWLPLADVVHLHRANPLLQQLVGDLLDDGRLLLP